jgi:hypothetical protein
MLRCEQQRCENNVGSVPFAAKLNAQFTAHSSRHLETLFLRKQQTEEEM